MLFHLLLSLFPLLIALFWVALLLTSKKNIIPNYFLALIFSLSIIPLFARLLYFDRQIVLFAWIDPLLIFTSLSIFPFLYNYIRLLTHEKEIDRGWMWMLLPSFLLALFSFFLSFAMSPEDFNFYIHHVLFREGNMQQPYPKLVQMQLIRLVACKITLAIQVGLSIYLGGKHLTQYIRTINGANPTKEENTLNRIKWLLWTFCVASAFYLFINAIWYFHFTGKESSLGMDCFVYGVFLSLLGFVAYHPYFSTVDLGTSKKERVRKQTTAKPKVVYMPDSSIIEQLNRLMKEEELFKNRELRINDLAKKVGTNRTYLSRILNDELGTNYNEWVNNFRIKYAKNIMHNIEHKDLSLEEISELSGFATLGVFYKVFKEKEKIPPGGYRKKVMLNQLSRTQRTERPSDL